MTSRVMKIWGATLATAMLGILVFWYVTDFAFARNITQYKDTISNSAPEAASNHTLAFTLGTNLNPGAYFEITPPPGFEILSTTTFAAERNVELRVNSVLRDSDMTQTASTDRVEIVPGTPGLIRYTLNTSAGISSGAQLQFKIGNHTSKSASFSEEYSTTTGTTTTQADVKPIINADTVGTYKVAVRAYDGGLVADADFSIALVEQVGIGPVDTTEIVPPYRFNGSPTSTVTGVTASVEIFLETDELAICRYSRTAGVAYSAMTSTFANTGLIFHTTIVSVTPNTTQTFYVRCIDDEGNFNVDDYLIQFDVSDTPTGTANDEGNVEGDGTGSGNDGTGSGGGGGGTEGEADGDAPLTGGSSGTGGGGGGGGGGTGGNTGDTAGGGFESTDAPYRSGDGRVVITGLAFPRSSVTVLVDGKVAVTERADGDGVYTITLDEIARGVYTFGVYAVDTAQNKSTTFSTSFTVTGARTSTLSNINISPTIKVSPDPVNPGQTLTLSGFTQPNATVTLENEKDGSTASRQTLTVVADASGAWSTTVSTNNFSQGTYKVRAKSTQGSVAVANFSTYVFYGVGQMANRPINADLNRDGKVNLVDFSILLFWWGTDGGTSDPAADINGDGKVNLVDFSILLFNWTG
jgi:Dockerin type I domain